LRQEILRIFRQTFAITYALELIGLIVAVAGLGITLASILVDRRVEFTTLRAMGVRHGELARASAWEGGILSLTGAVLGLILSLALGWVLIYVINKQTFGWTLEFVVPTGLLTALALLLGICGVGVSLAVGRWGADLAADRED
jgi:putative ABC transport system permease protein